MAMSGVLGARWTWARNRWKYCAAVEGWATRRFPCARQRQEALEACRGMLGSLTLEAMREQEHQPRPLTPLVLSGNEEVVDDDLGAVDEVAELRFPCHESVGAPRPSTRTRSPTRRTPIEGISNGEVPQIRTNPIQRGRSSHLGEAPGEMGQGTELCTGHVIDQDGVALAEGPPPGVLPVSRTSVPSASNEPRAIDSASAQSTSPAATISSRWTNWRSSLGCTVKPSGAVRVAHARSSRSGSGTPVATGWMVGAERPGRGRWAGGGGGSARTSSSARCRRALKSSSAASASSKVMSPRRTSVSV